MVVRTPLVTVITAGAVVAGTVVPGTITVRGPVDEAMDWVGSDKMLGMVTERPPLMLLLPLLLALLLDKEVRLEVELGEEVLELLLLELELLDEEELLELGLDEELLLDEVLELELALELGKVMSVLVGGRLGTLITELMGVKPVLPVHTPLQATMAPLTH